MNLSSGSAISYFYPRGSSKNLYQDVPPSEIQTVTFALYLFCPHLPLFNIPFFAPKQYPILHKLSSLNGNLIKIHSIYWAPSHVMTHFRYTKICICEMKLKHLKRQAHIHTSQCENPFPWGFYSFIKGGEITSGAGSVSLPIDGSKFPRKQVELARSGVKQFTPFLQSMLMFLMLWKAFTPKFH